MTTETITYDPSAALVLAAKAQTALTGATGFVIDSSDMYDIAADDLRYVKALQKEVEEKRTSITGPLNQAVKAVNDLFRAPKERLEQAEATLKRAMVAWTTEQERLAIEARRVAEEAARAERARMEEAARQAQTEAEMAAEAGDMEAAAIAQAHAEAAALTAQVVTIAPAVEVPTKVAGISGRVAYSAEVVDLMELVRAVAAGQAPVECLQADTKFLNAQARAFKRAGSLYPGVEARVERTISARAAI